MAHCLPWYDKKKTQTKADVEKSFSFSCPHCSKTFRENRSLKNHIKSVHDKTSKDGKIISSFSSIVCDLCKTNAPNASPRIFTSQEAFMDHKRAKHSGIHTNIKPDWLHQSSTNNALGSCKIVTSSSSSNATKTRNPNIIGSCQICDLHFFTKEEQTNHFKEFIPRSLSNVTSSSLNNSHGKKVDNDLYSIENINAIIHECSICHKRFSDKRALKQHFNVCAERKTKNSLIC